MARENGNKDYVYDEESDTFICDKCKWMFSFKENNKMIDKTIELLKILKKDIEDNKPLCPFPYRDLIYSVFLNNNGTLKEEFINAFSVEKMDDFYKTILIMGTANGTNDYGRNVVLTSGKGSISKNDLVQIIGGIIDELTISY